MLIWNLYLEMLAFLLKHKFTIKEECLPGHFFIHSHRNLTFAQQHIRVCFR